jgi:hypothetical protein
MKINKLRSSELDGAIYGMILGDGHITKPRSENGNCAIQLHHKLEQESYIDYKRSIIDQVGHLETKKRYNSSNLNGKVFQSVKVDTNHTKYCRKIRDIFYKNGRKTVSKKILKKLTPLGLALLYCDDGSLTIRLRKERIQEGKPNQYQFQGRIWTCSFTLEENNLIKDYFLTTWNIKIVVNKCNRKWKGQVLEYYYIRFPSLEFKKFVDIIKPHVPESMLYKIDFEKRIADLNTTY